MKHAIGSKQKLSLAQRAILSLGLVTSVVGLVVACGDAQLKAGGDGTIKPPVTNACSTPNQNCPCSTPGDQVACGRKVTGDLNFIYCYQGTRTCQANSVWGDCENGSMTTKSLTRLHTAAIGTTPVQCSGGLTADTLSVCLDGKRQGDFCATNADCANGERKCSGGADSTSSCKDDSDCAVTCTQYNGHCNGGTSPNIGCDGDADCPGGGTCNLSGGSNTCGSFNGICDSNTAEDGEACNNDSQCGAGGICQPPKFGVCIGGKLNGKKCKNSKHCKAGGVCSNEAVAGDGAVEAVDPCDPFCNVYSDTANGIDAGAGFLFADGGLTTAGCGDRAVVLPETCDDGNTTAGDGCSSSCKVEPGFFCPTPGAPCVVSTCGNNIVEGLEQCDDTPVGQTDRPYDGCFNCEFEVQCPPGTSCSVICGDGVKMGAEQCDDGNSVTGDGCDATCNIEPGATCTTAATALPPSIDVPIIYRDMAAIGQTSVPATEHHPDFQSSPPHNTLPAYPCVGAGTGNKTHTGIMQDTLVSVPGRAPAPRARPVVGGFNECNDDTVNSWYTDTPGLNQVILGHYLRLFQDPPASSTYVFNSTTDDVTDNKINCGTGGTTTCDTLNGFWPINNEGYGPYTTTLNYHFTSEVRFPFTYKGDGSEVLSFTGDDDVFVYVAGRKVVDLGGIHGALSGSTTLANNMTTTPPDNNAFTLTPGQTYEIAVFQAERQTTGSNYRLTLAGFSRSTSVCTKPPDPVTFTRDYQAVCPAGTHVVWQVFRWKATVPGASDGGDAGATSHRIDFAATTAATQAALPSDKADPSAVTAGTANASNSSATNWRFDGWPGDPLPLSGKLKAKGLESQSWMRVYMTFTGAPVLHEWQMLYDCIDAE